MPPTIRDVARAAGVSASSVSRALAGGKKLRPELRDEILRVAERLGYRANPLVAALMSQLKTLHPVHHAPPLALLHPFPSAAAWRRNSSDEAFLNGAAAQARRLGYALEPVCLPDAGKLPSRTLRILYHRGVAGVLAYSLPQIDWSSLPQTAHFALATAGVPAERPPGHRVGGNSADAMRTVLAELAQRDYRRIGLALNREGLTRSQGLPPSLLFAHQARIPRAQRVPPLLDAEWGEKEFIRWVRAARPDVILSYRHTLPDFLARAGFRVPEDIGLVNLEWRERVAGWSAIDPNACYAGAAAVDLLVEQLHRNERGLPAVPKTVLLRGTWVEGSTLRSVSIAK
jgi:LacI family transcriptional regulator